MRQVWALITLIALGVGAIYALGFVFSGDETSSATPPERISQVREINAALPAQAPEKLTLWERMPEELRASPAAVAYAAIAEELPDVSPESVQKVYRSKQDPSWVSVYVTVPGEDDPYILFLQENDKKWEVESTILADEPDHPQNEEAVLGGVPEDLVEPVYIPDSAPVLGLAEMPVETAELPEADPPEFADPDLTYAGVPGDRREAMKEELEEAQRAVKDFDGVAGFYAHDLEGDWGYGVRPDQVFYSASIIKVPIMVAVYRKVEQGELSLSDSYETVPEDQAAGAGWMQWDDPGQSYVLGDMLWMMMTQSDNVATNALVRLAGGPGYVNEVARSMGATDTALVQKVTSERGVVPSLDNRTTPRDMAVMLESIADDEAASPENCEAMVGLMSQNVLDSFLWTGLPDDAELAHKGGWLYRVHNEVGIVFHDERPYAVAILSEHAPKDFEGEARPALEKISASIWDAQGEAQGEARGE